MYERLHVGVCDCRTALLFGHPQTYGREGGAHGRVRLRTGVCGTLLMGVPWPNGVFGVPLSGVLTRGSWITGGNCGRTEVLVCGPLLGAVSRRTKRDWERVGGHSATTTELPDARLYLPGTLAVSSIDCCAAPICVFSCAIKGTFGGDLAWDDAVICVSRAGGRRRRDG